MLLVLTRSIQYGDIDIENTEISISKTQHTYLSTFVSIPTILINLSFYC